MSDFPAATPPPASDAPIASIPTPTYPALRVIRIVRLPPMVDPEDDPDWDDDEPDAPTPYWTPERIFFTVLIIVTLIAFLATSFSGLFQAPAPPSIVPTPHLPLSFI